MSEKLEIRDNREEGYFKIDTILIKDGYSKALGVYGVAVYAVLASYANNKTQHAYPSYQTIAGLLNCSRRQVIRAITTLEQLRLIHKESRLNNKGEYTSNLLTLLHRDQWIKPGGSDSQSLPSDSQSLPSDSQSLGGSDSQSPELSLSSLTNPKGANLREKGEYEPGKVAAAHTHTDSSSSSTAKREELQNHLAIKAIYERAGKYPVRDAQKKVVSVVGDSPAALARWADVLDYFISQGWHIVNPIRALDRFENGEIPARAQQDLHKGDPGYSLDISTGKYVPKKNGSAKYFVDPDTGEKFSFDTPGRAGRIGDRLAERSKAARAAAGLTPEEVEAYKHLAGETESDSAYPGAGIEGDLQNVTSWFKEAGGTNDQVRQNRTLFVDMLEKYRNTKTFKEIGLMALEEVESRSHFASLELTQGGKPRK